MSTQTIDVRSLRKKLGMNQAQFWSRVGLSQSAGSRKESGRRLTLQDQMLLKLAYGTAREKAKVAKAIGLA